MGGESSAKCCPFDQQRCRKGPRCRRVLYPIIELVKCDLLGSGITSPATKVHAELPKLFGGRACANKLQLEREWHKAGIFYSYSNSLCFPSILWGCQCSVPDHRTTNNLQTALCSALLVQALKIVYRIGNRCANTAIHSQGKEGKHV